MSELLAKQLSEVLSGQLSLGEFQDWFIQYVMGRDPVRPEDAEAAEDIESAMAEFTGGHISEDAFRRVLRHHFEDAPIIADLPGRSPQVRWSSSANRTQFVPLEVNG